MITETTSPKAATSHRWTMRFTVSLSAIIALFGTWGWLTHYGLLSRDLALAAGGVLMAGVCLVAQGACNNLAVEARRARARGLRWSYRAAGLVALGFGAISALGLHHGWQIAEAVAPDLGVTPPPDWLTTTLFVFVAFGEPISFWVVDAIRTASPRQDQSVDAQTPTNAERPARRRAWSPRVVEATKTAAKAALGAALVATAAVGEPDAAAQSAPAPAWEISARSSAVGNQDRARELAAAGWSERRIAVELGDTRHAVRRALGRAA